ncbi:MAG: hypothetical protein GWP14_00845 [Actinobacteria bacterium]|nr:hypothetical protein [Actinomycetota bacterium]
MRIAKVAVLILMPSFLCPLWTAGCSNRQTQMGSGASLNEQSSWAAGKRAWQNIAVGKSSYNDVAAVFETTVSDKDRYAYALDEDNKRENTFLMMVNLDEDGIVAGKYYWERVTTSALLAKTENWEIAMDTRIPAAVLQEYTSGVGPREEAILAYFATKLYGIAEKYEHLNEVFGATGAMKRIFTLAASEYNMRADKQALRSPEGFVFDGDIYGDKCTMSLVPIDERAGWYFLVLKGKRSRNFFTGW